MGREGSGDFGGDDDTDGDAGTFDESFGHDSQDSGVFQHEGGGQFPEHAQQGSPAGDGMASWMPVVAGLGGLAAGTAMGGWMQRDSQGTPQGNAREQQGRVMPPVQVPPGRSRRRQTTQGTWLGPLLNFGVVALALYLWLVAYGPQQMELGYGESRLIQVSSTFASSVKMAVVGGGGGQVPQPVLYHFDHVPRLSRDHKWSEYHPGVRVAPNGYHDWAFWLNRGSEVKVEFEVEEPGVYFVLLKGVNHFKRWLSNPRDVSVAEYHTFAQGKGFFKYKASSSAEYYFAYGNLGRSPIHLTTNFEVKSRVYDTRQARRSCSSGECMFQLEYGGEEAEVIVTPDASGTDAMWYVRIEYGPRWMAYLVLIGATWLLTSLFDGAMCRRRRYQQPPVEYQPLPGMWPPPAGGQGRGEQPGAAAPWQQPAPPAQQSAYPSTQHWVPWAAATGLTQDGPGITGSLPPQEGSAQPAVSGASYAYPGSGSGGVASAPPFDENDVCAVCFDKRKETIFDPCGHRATCYECGIRLSQGPVPVCPICRTRIRQVLKIYEA